MCDSVEVLRWGFPSATLGLPLTSLPSETSCLKELGHAGQQDWKWWFTVLRLAGGDQGKQSVCYRTSYCISHPKRH